MEPSTYGNFAGALLVGGYGAVRLIRLIGGKKNNSAPKEPPTCPDAGCHGQVGQNKDDIAETKENFKEFKADIYPKIDQTSKDVSFIKGWIDGKKPDE